ncbi:peroxisomal acyl-coenzyme A oxidase 3 [Agrilus planipennis]|uniref:Acyl-coenzyme A oxidase n=1 Tax=Agrilus planipennis TaxID=224129 RepID=A0A1W4X903_AGRPL|nr:peroxisomal acyl-coenzyme A oxidase 3 [Agrilus planipennis]XP_018332515.1 peroxisomal acyl-coenzyme A oxidase 3 [Agrilus planipennis]XP_018332516.1 peroxisomal acyl-coenzyme A oxidase 3 [Agrilus planipennis]
METSSTSFIEDLPKGPLDTYRTRSKLNWKKLKLVFEDEEQLKTKIKLWKTLEQNPIFHDSGRELNSDEMKRLAAVRLHQFRKLDFLPKSAVNKGNHKQRMRHLMTVNEAMNICFPDVSVKQAIGMLLLATALEKLGTDRHQFVINGIWNRQILGSVSLTEVAHGSNTKDMKTTATYDRTTQEFVINTPDFQAAKCWGGNLGKTATWTLLFAQLIIDEQPYGLHLFIVPIRDPKTLLSYPGIVVGDMGEKIGLNGIDNGFIIFKDYRIPREYLLNRAADVTPEGNYESSLADPAKILGAVLETLSTARVGIMQECSNMLVSGVTIAVRYGAVRRQFKPSDGSKQEELPLIEYPLHQWRLFPYMATAAVFRIFVTEFAEDYTSSVEKSASETHLGNLNDLVAEIHATVAAMKPLISWTCRDGIQECREACGGYGFLKSARLGDLKSTNDPCVTYEGDNNVLIQQTSNWLIRQWNSLLEEGKVNSPLGTCAFLKNYRRTLSKKFTPRVPGDVVDKKFVWECYEWLITYLVKVTDEKQKQLVDSGLCKFNARNNTQVYRAAILSKVYGEFTALNYYWNRIQRADQDLVLTLNKLGLLYGLWSLDKHLIYFYEGSFATDNGLIVTVKQEILKLCSSLKDDAVTIIDALAPPDFILNSVLGSSDGKVYERLESMFYRNPGALSRPSWWHEILPDSPINDTKLVSKL